LAGAKLPVFPLKKSLGEAAYDVLVVPDEPAAVEALQQLSPSLIVTDRGISNCEN
jgi:CheY-like chemotaxis protein